VDIAAELIKTLGPAGLIAVILWIMLGRSEEREEKKDLRIQLLENLLTESYDERIEAANQMSNVIHSNTAALLALTNEVRLRKDA
jgi:hypothetical protein